MHRPGRRILLRVSRTSLRVLAPLVYDTTGPFTCSAQRSIKFSRYVHIEQSSESLPPVKGTSQSFVCNSFLSTSILNLNTPFNASLKAFEKLRLRELKLEESLYLSLLYKALREGHNERVWDGYQEFLRDESLGKVRTKPGSRTAWSEVSVERMQMLRFVLWAMLDTNQTKAMEQFYQSEVVGKYNRQGIYEADSLNFLLRLECTSKVLDEQEQGLRLRVETLLHNLEQLKFHTSYSSAHALFRLIVHRPEIFIADKEKTSEAVADTYDSAEATGDIIIGYFNRFPCAMALESKRISIAISSGAAAGQHDAAQQLVQYGLNLRVPIDAGSFAHTVEEAPDDTKRVKIADLYLHAKERELVCTIHGSESSIINYLLFHAVSDSKLKLTMELLHEMQLNNNVASNRTVCKLFKSMAEYRARIRKRDNQSDASKKLTECPTIVELFDRFSNVIPRTAHLFSQGIMQSLYAADLAVALDLMRAALCHDVKLLPKIYSQVLYRLLARGGDEFSDAKISDCFEVEQGFNRQYPNERTHLNSIVVNICQSYNDFSTMLVCLDRWKALGHPPVSRRVIKSIFDVISKWIQRLRKDGDAVVPGTVFVVDGMELSYLAFLVRYRTIVTWDAWTIESAIVRARTSGLYAEVVALLAEATSRGLMLSSTAYIVSLCVLDEVDEAFAIVACVKTMKANKAWEKVVRKNPGVQDILDRAIVSLEKEKTLPKHQ